MLIVSRVTKARMGEIKILSFVDPLQSHMTDPAADLPKRICLDGVRKSYQSTNPQRHDGPLDEH